MRTLFQREEIMNLSKSCAPLSTFTIFVCAILCTSFVVAGGQSMNLSNASTQGTASTSMSLTLDSSAQTEGYVAAGNLTVPSVTLRTFQQHLPPPVPAPSSSFRRFSTTDSRLVVLWTQVLRLKAIPLLRASDWPLRTSRLPYGSR